MIRLKVGDIEIEAPDTMKATEFASLIDQILMRIPKLTKENIDLKKGVVTPTPTAVTLPTEYT